MGVIESIYNLFADLGDWLTEEVKNSFHAFVIALLSLIAPLGFIFVISFIASSNRKQKKKK